MRFLIHISLLIFVFCSTLGAQELSDEKTRILFLMDASASMNNSWEATRKIDDAKRIISDLADSLRTLENLELALRVYGHQSMPSAKDCRDSRIEVPFGSANSIDIFKRLASLRPKGITPITYSLESAAKDFPNDPLGEHYIILITDGDESCEGDPCETAARLKKKGIVLKSFVIGLGLQDETKEKFQCFDDFYDASDAWTFQSLLKSIVSKIISKTTSHLDIIDRPGEPSITDVGILVYDRYSREPDYSFYHSLNSLNNSDTLLIDTGLYHLDIQTIPPIELLDQKIYHLKHTPLQTKASFTELRISLKNKIRREEYNVSTIIRDNTDKSILNVQELGQNVEYINQPYKVEILTKPEILMDNLDPTRNDVNLIEISEPGELVLDKKTSISGAIFYKEDDKRLKLISHLNGKSIERINLQEGTYTIIYRPKLKKEMNASRTESVYVHSGKSITLRLE